MTSKDFDVIIIGAGLIGLASAYYAKIHDPKLSILVVEKEHTYAQGNTGRSVAGFRDFFSTSINFKLAKASINFYDYIQNRLGYDIGMRYVGYLFLMSNKKFNSMKSIINELSNTSKIEILREQKIKNISNLNLKLDKKESRILNLEPVEVGVIGKNCGILEIENLSSFYYQKCKELGIEFKFDFEVLKLKVDAIHTLEYPGEPFLWQKKRISEIITKNGSLSANIIILTTGAWTNKLLDGIGVDSHIKIKKRFVFQIGGEEIGKMINQSYELNEESIFPFTVLPSHGIYLRPYPLNSTFWISTSGTTSDQEIGTNFSYEAPNEIEYIKPNNDYFTYNILPILRAYFNNFSNVKITGSWTGYYSLNTQDKTPYIFTFLNAIVATGGSGAGVMKADSIGRIVANVLMKKKYTTLFDETKIKNSDLGILDRNVGIESLRF